MFCFIHSQLNSNMSSSSARATKRAWVEVDLPSETLLEEFPRAQGTSSPAGKESVSLSIPPLSVPPLSVCGTLSASTTSSQYHQSTMGTMAVISARAFVRGGGTNAQGVPGRYKFPDHLEKSEIERKKLVPEMDQLRKEAKAAQEEYSNNAFTFFYYVWRANKDHLNLDSILEKTRKKQLKKCLIREVTKSQYLQLDAPHST
uniref:Uncharacterized protein n=1 Tax=Cannabis sativa TaxID=3483 RepID=A0A803PSM9_CANSA